MSEMREWWANVYADGPVHWLGQQRATLQDLHEGATEMAKCGCPARYRLHVRMKPEGAPKRYASEANRRAWETQPDKCRVLAQTWLEPENIIAVRQP
jgi:hypothetical protein